MAREVVDGEAQLVALGAGLAPGALPASPPHADPGVADEHVEAVGLALHRHGEASDLPQVGEVGAQEAQAGARRALTQLLEGLRAALRAAPVQQQPRARGRELAGQGTPEAVGGPGDEDGLLLERRHAREPTAAGRDGAALPYTRDM